MGGQRMKILFWGSLAALLSPLPEVPLSGEVFSPIERPERHGGAARREAECKNTLQKVPYPAMIKGRIT